jgi:hypothetical protein
MRNNQRTNYVHSSRMLGPVRAFAEGYVTTNS